MMLYLNFRRINFGSNNVCQPTHYATSQLVRTGIFGIRCDVCIKTAGNSLKIPLTRINITPPPPPRRTYAGVKICKICCSYKYCKSICEL